MKKRARALMDLQHYAVKCGHVLEAPHQLINALAEGGEVDPHPDAVAYALDNGFSVVPYGIEEPADPAPAAKRARKPKTDA